MITPLKVLSFLSLGRGTGLDICEPLLTYSAFLQFYVLFNNISIISGQWEGDINSLTTEKQTTKFSSANFQKILNPSYTILRIQRLEG